MLDNCVSSYHQANMDSGVRLVAKSNGGTLVINQEPLQAVRSLSVNLLALLLTTIYISGPSSSPPSAFSNASTLPLRDYVLGFVGTNVLTYSFIPERELLPYKKVLCQQAGSCERIWLSYVAALGEHYFYLVRMAV